jgi:hypothetical protein
MPVTMALSTLVNTCNASPGLRTMWSAPSSGTGKTGKALGEVCLTINHLATTRQQAATGNIPSFPGTCTAPCTASIPDAVLVVSA